MDKKLKNIVEKTIELKFNQIQDRNLEDMEDLKEYEVRSKRIIEIQRKLCDVIPKEMQDLLDEYGSLEIQQLCSEIRHYFKKGVKAGLTDLKFLEEAEQEMLYL